MPTPTYTLYQRSANGVSPSFAYPPSVAAGDILAGLFVFNNLATTVGVSGWTSLAQASNVSCCLFGLKCSGSEGGGNFQLVGLTGGNAGAAGWGAVCQLFHFPAAQVYAGATVGDVIDQINPVIHTNTPDPDTGLITAGWGALDTCLFFASVGFLSQLPTSVTVPGGYTLDANTLGDSTVDVRAITAHKAAIAASDNPGAWDTNAASGTDSVSLGWVVRPPAAAGAGSASKIQQQIAA